MTVCEMNAHQLATYVNAWVAVSAVVITGLIQWVISKAITAYEIDHAYAQGVRDTEAKFRPAGPYAGHVE